MNVSKMHFKVITCLIILLLLYSFVFKASAIAYAQYTGREILVFLAGAIVGGVVYDGVKWAFIWVTSALTPLGQAAVLAILAAAGIAAFVVYMRNSNEVDRVEDESGCIYRNGFWACPIRITDNKLQQQLTN